MIKEKHQQEWEKLARNVQYLRTEFRIPKCQMAKLLHISVYTLNKIEALEIPPRLTIEFLFHLSFHFRYTPYQLLSRRLVEND